MALSTYSELLTAIPRWAWRTGDTEFEEAVPEFIALTENVLNNGDDDVTPLRIREMECEDEISLSGNRGDLPSDFLEIRSISYTADDIPLPGDAFQIIGSEIFCDLEDAGDLKVKYYRKIPALSSTVQTNWLLQKDHRVYLYGALVQAAPFAREDDRMALWGTRFAAALGGIAAADNRSKYSRSSIRTTGPTP